MISHLLRICKLNIEYDGKTTSNNVGNNTQESQARRRGGEGNIETGERSQDEVQYADSRGGTTGVSERVVEIFTKKNHKANN